MADFKTNPPPNGFCASTTTDGYPKISYQATATRGAVIFMACWITGWTFACVFFTWVAIFNDPQPSYGLLLFLVPFWGADFLVVGYALWVFCSLTTFVFHEHQLVVERKLWRYARRREFSQGSITAVRQLKDGGGEIDSFPSWGLAIEGSSNVKVLSKEAFDKSQWLGPIVAHWAGIVYEPHREKNYEQI